MTQPEIRVDLTAVRHNVGVLRALVAPAAVMVVVKADGYGHGMAAVARAAREAGADWLGVATPDEAVALRDAGDEGPLLCWLAAPGQDYRPAVERGVTLTAYDAEQVAAIAHAGATGLQLKVDTGLSRGGAARADWDALFEAARSSRLDVTGVWSHLACSDQPDYPANQAQQAAYEEAVALGGFDGAIRHLANSAAALTRPQARYDLVRVGLAAYGLDPAPGTQHGVALRPAMSVTAPLALVKDLQAGAGVSYGHSFVADRPMRVGLVPVGYGDGVPRHASNAAEVLVGGRSSRILGRVCMDQFVVEVPEHARAGDEVVLWGPGGPSAQEWAEACGTISYEIVTRVGGRFARRYVGSPA